MSSAQYVILKKLENTKQCSKTLFLFHFSILHRIYFYTIFVIKNYYTIQNITHHATIYIYICIYLIINIINPPCRTSTYKITYTIPTTLCRQFSNTGTSINFLAIPCNIPFMRSTSSHATSTAKVAQIVLS